MCVCGAGSSLMRVTMCVCWRLPGVLLLLVLTGSNGSVGAEKQDAEDERGAHFRAMWKLHMKGKDALPVTVKSKQQLLYCRVGIGYHLQILPGGSVGGVHQPTKYCWLKVCAVKRGVVALQGVESRLYLCMSTEGWAYGAEKFSDECMLKENLEENHYNTYSSVSHPHVYLALSHRGRLRRGKGLNHHHRCTHFLPRRTLISSDTPLRPLHS